MVYLDVTLYRFPMVVNEFNILTPSARQSWLKKIDAQFPSLPIEGFSSIPISLVADFLAVYEKT